MEGVIRLTGSQVVIDRNGGAIVMANSCEVEIVDENEGRSAPITACRAARACWWRTASASA